MDFKYIHNIKNKQVFCVPLNPNVVKNIGTGGWSVSMEISTMIAGNRINRDRSWEKPLRLFPEQLFNDNYTEKQVISHFLSNNTPIGVEISKDEYSLYYEKYKEESKNL